MHPAADPSSDRTGRSHDIRFWKIVWRSGGPWERLFVAWFWIGLGLAVTIAIGGPTMAGFPSRRVAPVRAGRRRGHCDLAPDRLGSGKRVDASKTHGNGPRAC